MKLWQIVLTLPSSTASHEKGFFKLNRIKNDDRSRLCLETLDTLMFLSLSAPQELHEVDWNAIYETWTGMKTKDLFHWVKEINMSFCFIPIL